MIIVFGYINYSHAVRSFFQLLINIFLFFQTAWTYFHFTRALSNLRLKNEFCVWSRRYVVILFSKVLKRYCHQMVYIKGFRVIGKRKVRFNAFRKIKVQKLLIRHDSCSKISVIFSIASFLFCSFNWLLICFLSIVSWLYLFLNSECFELGTYIS